MSKRPHKKDTYPKDTDVYDLYFTVVSVYVKSNLCLKKHNRHHTMFYLKEKWKVSFKILTVKNLQLFLVKSHHVFSGTGLSKDIPKYRQVI